MHKIGKRALALVAGAFLAGGLAAGTAGIASAAPVYSDTSVSVVGLPFVDSIAATPIASASVLLPAGATFTLHATTIGAPTWAPETVVQSGITFNLASTGAASIEDSSFPVIPGTTQFVASVSNAGGAISKAIVTVTWTSATTGSYAVTADDVTLPLAITNNTSGTVDLLPVIAGVSEVITNEPAGVALAGGSVMATTAIPGLYHNLKVTATDAAGSTAVEAFSTLVKGFVVKPTVPHLTKGHVLDVNNNDATIGWSYVDYGTLKECATTQTFGFGFTVAGSPHIGFTCFNATKPQDLPNGDVGYWAGLAAGHTYDIKLVPAERNAVTGVITDIPGAPAGWVTIVTTK